MTLDEANAVLDRLGVDASAEYVPDTDQLYVHPGERLTREDLMAIARELPGAWVVMEAGSPIHWRLTGTWHDGGRLH
ncbi:hypothetical protein [Lichenibacterium dinghuense]|uniref:hypothetical protein n=1 Tax=Lichenibacterium dinghuense TaxID=2895977 RepID=UPI001F2B79B1|nr:hypothetical protein [Lichenibacterium sp. 6Y81]